MVDVKYVEHVETYWTLRNIRTGMVLSGGYHHPLADGAEKVRQHLHKKDEWEVVRLTVERPI